MYEIVVGRELRDEKSIGVTPDFAADANSAAIINCVGQKLRNSISLCVNRLFISKVDVGNTSQFVSNFPSGDYVTEVTLVVIVAGILGPGMKHRHTGTKPPGCPVVSGRQ